MPLPRVEFEPINNSGLEIARGVLAVQSVEVDAELRRLSDEYWAPTNAPGITGLFGEKGIIDVHPSGLFFEGKPVSGLSKLGEAALAPVFNNNRLMIVNRQAGNTYQPMHQDFQPDYVWHISDGEVGYDNGAVKWVPVAGGDVVRNSGDVFHGGGNPTDIRRFTAVLFSIY